MSDGTQPEYGLCGEVRFIDPIFIKMYDISGKEVDIPKCANCGVFKSLIMGKSAQAWFCMNNCQKENV